MGQYGSNGFSFDKLADTIRRTREAVSKFSASGYTPGSATPNPFDFMGKVGGAAAPAFGLATQGDILTNYKPPWERTPYPAADAMADHARPSTAYPQAEDPMAAASYYPSASASPSPVAGVPMPRARPEEAPQPEPDTSFFMRNAMMMRDPVTGELIDPQGAASVRGPDLISKMMGYLNKKV
jgi:hypothetical protein